MNATIETTVLIKQATENARNDWEKSFVSSCQEQHGKGRSMTPKQLNILQRIYDYSQPTASAVGPYSPMVSLLSRAGQKLKYPKVTFVVSQFTNLTISLAPKTGKNPGSIYLKAIRTMDEDYIGKVSPQGGLQFARSTSESDEALFTRFLTMLNDDPVNAARDHGAKTGNCCFCHLPLKTEISTAHGYGPTCAKNWGLPWSTKTGRATQEEQYNLVNADIHEAVGGQWNVVDNDTGGVIMTFNDRRTAEDWVDQHSTIQRA
jgi:hypothetical protein